MANIKYGPVLTYKDIEEARKLIGKKVIVSDKLSYIEEARVSSYTRLTDVREDLDFPFIVLNGNGYQFVREVIEEPSLMTYRQLARWLGEHNGQRKDSRADENKGGALICTHLIYETEDENKSVPDFVRIRSWDSNEWLTPTLDIYERDCGAAKARDCKKEETDDK